MMDLVTLILLVLAAAAIGDMAGHLMFDKEWW